MRVNVYFGSRRMNLKIKGRRYLVRDVHCELASLFWSEIRGGEETAALFVNETADSPNMLITCYLKGGLSDLLLASSHNA